MLVVVSIPLLHLFALALLVQLFAFALPLPFVLHPSVFFPRQPFDEPVLLSGVVLLPACVVLLFPVILLYADARGVLLLHVRELRREHVPFAVCGFPLHVCVPLPRFHPLISVVYKLRQKPVN